MSQIQTKWIADKAITPAKQASLLATSAQALFADGSGGAAYRSILSSDISTLNQNTTGSAATLTTPRNINGVSFNGSAPITVTADAGTLTGTTLNSFVVTSSLTSVGTISTGTWAGTTI